MFERRAPDDAHQLALRVLELVMEPPDRAEGGARVVVLHEQVRKPCLHVATGVVALQKEAPRVDVHLWLDDDDASQFRGDDSHGASDTSLR